VDVPWEVIVISATAISLGTAAGGWRIMKTMGHRVVEL
jgi:PiT family inorganic phosphate transporter